jgi:hypothetical protein
MSFLGFILGICEANAFSAYKMFAEGRSKMMHSQFKAIMVFQMLKYCGQLMCDSGQEESLNKPMLLRSGNSHQLIHLPFKADIKRRKLACKRRNEQGISHARVEKRCSYNATYPYGHSVITRISGRYATDSSE